MADQIISNALGTVIKSGTAGVSGGFFSSGWIVLLAIFMGVALVSVVGAFVWFFWFEGRQWNIVTRVHYENPTINGITLGGPVPTKRVRFKDGRVVYMYKSPIQGYTISPELLVWTRPREHDVIVTQDKKVFCILGIENIDTQRKKLNVDISYPDIEMDRQDLQQHIDSKKFDDPNERFKILAKVTLWIFVMVTVIVLAVLGGKAYVEGKNADLQRDQLNLQTSESQAKVINDLTTFTAILARIMPDLLQIKGYQVQGNYTQ